MVPFESMFPRIFVIEERWIGAQISPKSATIAVSAVRAKVSQLPKAKGPPFYTFVGLLWSRHDAGQFVTLPSIFVVVSLIFSMVSAMELAFFYFI